VGGRTASDAATRLRCRGPELSERSVNAHLTKLTKDLLKASTGRLCDVVRPAPTTLVIFSRGRTGSNFLVSLLASHPQICQHGEIVGESYLQHEFIRDEINRIGVVPYLEHARRRLLAERVVAVKFLYYQLETEYAQRWHVPELPALLPVLQAKKELRIVHLKRRNHLATLISWKLARQTQRWRQPGASRPPDAASKDDHPTINLSYDECQHEFEQTERWQTFYDNAFAAHPFVEIYYEDLVAHREREMARVLDLVGLESRELRSPLRKQNTHDLADIIENYGELRQRFAGTPYAAFFTNPAA
jgi:LPS sulfotransferase NodH